MHENVGICLSDRTSRAENTTNAADIQIYNALKGKNRAYIILLHILYRKVKIAVMTYNYNTSFIVEQLCGI